MLRPRRSLSHRHESEGAQPSYHRKERVLCGGRRHEMEREKLGGRMLFESLYQAVPRASPTPAPFTSDGQ